MSTYTGIQDISTLLRERFASAAAFGLDTIQQILAADIAAHNALVNDMVSELVEVSTDRQRIYGTSVSGEMVEVDEYGRAPTQRTLPGSTTGFPLRLFQYSLGWTNKWMQIKTPADLAEGTLGAEKAHLKAVQKQIKTALFLSSNYDWVDFLVDGVTLNVKRLVNADSAPIPDDPFGGTFDGSTHTHYTAAASLSATNATALINNVVEHGFGGEVRLAINRGDEAAFRALTGFVAYQDPRLVFGASTTGIPETRLDLSRLDNRPIGIFGAAEVWVKPWVPRYYAFAWDAASPQKPLVFRQRDAATLQGLRIAATDDDYPLYSQYMEAEYGIGVWTRTNGAVLYFNNASWADPTF